MNSVIDVEAKDNKPLFSTSKMTTPGFTYLYLHYEDEKEELLFSTIDLSTGEFHLQPMSIDLGSNLHQALHDLLMQTIFIATSIIYKNGNLEARKFCLV